MDCQVTTPLHGPPDEADPKSAAGGQRVGPGGSSSGTRHDDATPSDRDSESYDATAPKNLRPAQLLSKEQGGFSSAGALTLRRGNGGEPEVLLGMEYHEGLKPLGGRRDHAREMPLDVACREFCEETGYKLDKGSLRALFSNPPARQVC